MKLIRSPYFFISVVIYAIIRLGRTAFGMSGWINNHLTDLLCMPIILSILLFIAQWIKKDRTLILPWFSIVATVLYWSVYFEWYLPSQSMDYTSDHTDVIMYVLGGIIFYFWQRKVFRKLKPLHPEYLP